MSVPSLHELKFLASSLNNDDEKISYEVQKMGDLLRKAYGFGLTSTSSKNKFYSQSALIPLFITGKNNKIPNLASIIWEIYCQWKLISIWKVYNNPHMSLREIPRNYSFKYFQSISKPFQLISDKKREKIFSFLNDAIEEYHFNYFWPISRNKSILINDSYSSFVKYSLAMPQAINSVISRNDDLLPLQIDFWIIPKSVMIKEYKKWKRSKFEKKYEYVEQEDEVILNIDKRLKLGNIKYIKVPLQNETDMSMIAISRVFARKIVEILGNKKEEQQSNRRIMVIIDRRNAFYDLEKEKDSALRKLKHSFIKSLKPHIECNKNKKIRNNGDQIYFYEVDNKYGEIPDNYIQEKLIYNTQQYIMPFCKIKKIKDEEKSKSKYEYELDGGASYSWESQLFLLSFHLNSANDYKSYWYFNCSMMRFLPNNIINIWPNYFYKNEKGDHKKQIKKWNLPVTDSVFDKYYKELMEQV